MPSYGMDVPTRMGLKTVIPQEWQLFVHRSVALPETMNWNRGEAWPAVLTKFASDNQMAVLIDWDNHVVMLRSPEQALEEGAKRQEIAQAATTPLPKFEDAKPKTEPTKDPVLAQRTADAPAQPAAAVTPLPKFNITTAPDKARTVAQHAEPAAAAPAVSVQAKPDAPLAPVAATPFPSVKPAAAATVALAQAKPDTAAAPASATANPFPAVKPAAAVAHENNAERIAAAQKAGADADAKLAAVVHARDAESAKLAAAQKARAEEDSKLASAQKAREAEAAKLAAAQQAREAEAGKLAGVQKAREAEAAKLAGVQKAAEAEAAKLAELKKAREAEAAKLAAAEAAAKAAVVPMPVIRVNPTPAMVASQQIAAKNAPAVKLASTDEFTYTGPVALNRPSARKVAQGIADRFNLRLVYAAEEFALPGPVTLLAESAEQDAKLLERAIGSFGPAVLEVDAAQKVLRVIPRNASAQQLAEIRSRRPAAPVAPAAAPTVRVTFAAPAVAPAPAAAAPVVAAPAPVAVAPQVAAPAAPMVAVAVTATPTVVVKPAQDGVLTLDVPAHQPLENAVVRLARTQGYTVEWKVSGGFDANRAMSFTGHTLREVLAQVLPKLGLSADILTREKHIVVRPADAAQDR
jgi:hypothetical protein